MPEASWKSLSLLEKAAVVVLLSPFALGLLHAVHVRLGLCD
jgi:hypothetical protein